MQKRILITVICILAGISCAQAQFRFEESHIEVVTDANGQHEEIGVPEGLTQNIDSLLDLYASKMYLQVGTDCGYQNYDPETPEETYIERLKRLPHVMDMSYNATVRKFIDRYTKRARRQVSYILGAANFYIPIFEEALETYGLPLELKYLPVIESALNPKAVSRVGATGLWQFMLATGKRYGLKVNSLVDERRDPVKASYAAARYLSDLYRIFGDWNLVLAAYNAGPTNVNKAIHRARGERDYWKIARYLPTETRGYVPSFIAANYIMNYYCEHNICPMETRLPLKSDTIMVNQDVNFEQISNVIGIDIDRLQELNPQYRRNIINGNSEWASVRIPHEFVSKFIDQQEAIYNYGKEPPVPAETLPAISASALVASNETTHHEAKKDFKPDTHNIRLNGDNASSVKVEQGQTLFSIARTHGISVDQLKRINNLKGNTIQVGREIRLR